VLLKEGKRTDYGRSTPRRTYRDSRRFFSLTIRTPNAILVNRISRRMFEIAQAATESADQKTDKMPTTSSTCSF
jgi:hypothetical protein